MCYYAIEKKHIDRLCFKYTMDMKKGYTTNNASYK